MKNNKKKYQEAFSEIHISKELETKILNKIANKDNKKNIFTRPVIAAITLILIVFISISAVFAKEIIEKYWYNKTKVEDKTSYKHILKPNDVVEIIKNANLNLGDDKSIEFIEKELGIKILTSDKMRNDIFNIADVKKKNNHIYSVSLRSYNCIDYKGQNILIEELIKKDSMGSSIEDLRKQQTQVDIYIDFITQYADKDEDNFVTEFWSNEDLLGKEDEIERYYLKNLDTNVYIKYYNLDYNQYASFVYEDMLYTIHGKWTGRAEMIEILESLK